MTDVPSAFTDERRVDAVAQTVEEGLYEVERRVIGSHFIESDATVLDLGCGTGRTTGVLDEMGFEVVGVDVSEPMVSRARQLFPDIEFRSGDARDLQFDDERFDYVLFSFNGLDYVKPEGDRYVALREIWRVLKPGGTFAFSSHNPFYLLPADPTSLYGYLHLARFWKRNLLDGTVTSRYKTDAYSTKEMETYFISPRGQRKQLARCGFELLEIVHKESLPSAWLDPWPYYVARRRPQ
jgi:ubiquinone/menaquinone biosynthesis C-methylase UbiE